MSPITIRTVSMERLLKISFIVLFAIGFAGYACFQARNLIQGPSVVLQSEPEIVQTERAITLVGTAENVVVLRLNGREIHTNEAGVFEHTLVLENGYTIMTIEAEDRYGRKTNLTRTFVYKPKA